VPVVAKEKFIGKKPTLKKRLRPPFLKLRKFHA